MTYISSQSFSTALQQSILQAQNTLTQVQTESVSGVLADSGLTLGAQTGSTLSFKSQIDNLNAITASNSFASSRLDTTSTALDSLISGAQTMSQNLVTAGSTGGVTSALQGSAQGALQTMISALNSSDGGQYVFGGLNTSTTPIQNYFSTTTSAAKSAIDTSFSSAFGFSQTSASASTITGSAMTAYLDDTSSTGLDAQFSGANWAANWSSASDSTMQSTISPSQTVSTSVSANQTAFQQIAEAYTILSEFTGSNMSADASSAAVTKATSLVNSALGSLTNIQAGVGLSQNAITNANSSMSSQVTVLQTHVGDLENVDVAGLSTQVSQLSTQLQASYELTSQLHQLSLVNYLTTAG